MKKAILRLTAKMSVLAMMVVIGLGITASSSAKAMDFCDDARAAHQLCLMQWAANGYTLETYPEYAQCRLDSGIDQCQ